MSPQKWEAWDKTGGLCPPPPFRPSLKPPLLATIYSAVVNFIHNYALRVHLRAHSAYIFVLRYQRKQCHNKIECDAKSTVQIITTARNCGSRSSETYSGVSVAFLMRLMSSWLLTDRELEMRVEFVPNLNPCTVPNFFASVHLDSYHLLSFP